jgi:hypothetical protein
MPIRRSGIAGPYVSAASGEAITALDWNGNPSGRRAIVFVTGVSVAPPTAYPMTYIWKVFQRNQVSGVGDGSRYYTTFFHGPYGVFTGGNNYYGCHPYPVPPEIPNPGDGKWELSTNSQDYTGRGTNQANSGGDPFVTNGQWYSQALVVSSSGGNLNHKFYIALPSTSSTNFIEQNFAATYSAPGTPCITWGQAPDNGSGASWGGYSRWEEQNARIRGIQIYTTALTEAQIVALAAMEYDSDVKTYWSANSITSHWYLNMNPRTDKIGDQRDSSQHNPALVSTNGAAPADWTQ